VTALASAGAGFLAAVLWFDLMFDVQVLRHRGSAGDPPEEVLASIAGYYRRVTTAAAPMNRLVAAAMLTTLVAIVIQVSRGDSPRWAGWISLALVGAAILLAARRTVPAAVRLGARGDPPATQGRLAWSILRDHVLCLGAITALLVIQLAFAQ
jgi:hypothetical protein